MNLSHWLETGYFHFNVSKWWLVLESMPEHLEPKTCSPHTHTMHIQLWKRRNTEKSSSTQHLKSTCDSPLSLLMTLHSPAKKTCTWLLKYQWTCNSSPILCHSEISLTDAHRILSYASLKTHHITLTSNTQLSSDSIRPIVPANQWVHLPPHTPPFPSHESCVKMTKLCRMLLHVFLSSLC